MLLGPGLGTCSPFGLRMHMKIYTRQGHDRGKENRIPRTYTVAVLIFLCLGMAIPFWMAYKSAAEPIAVRRLKRHLGLEFDAGKKYYCPACGGEVNLPSWRDSQLGPLPRTPLLSVQNLSAPDASRLNFSTRVAPVTTAIHEY